jgi:hypothetical protein
MGRSVDYLNNAERVNYFQWPTLFVYDPETDRDVETDELEDAEFIISDIQETIKSNFPGFDNCGRNPLNMGRWDGNEVHIILEGYGVEIGLSEYCGLATLSVRVDQRELDYCETDKEADAEYQKALNWINENWDEAAKYWGQYRKIGTFSNGEGVYEKIN